jgi:hypothetical protein
MRRRTYSTTAHWRNSHQVLGITLNGVQVRFLKTRLQRTSHFLHLEDFQLIAFMDVIEVLQ